ncbi:hypothetical protein GE115_08925 [Agromyces sp. CFH 90414]|uniref:Uncharacterized protein n=1 Tax=Agromyces agglutinans TaxID=2662258 RepID=A0A6I2F5W8_9MICO|nr:hypothetical protein [Agromyces agglutinans]MRG59989.1 hypothetical protein [Agromyces agglutinans]
MTDGPATRYARAARTWAPIDWWKLEARAVYERPELRRALAPFAPVEAWRDLAKDVATAWGILLTLSHIAALTLPVLAGGMLLGWLFQRDDLAPVGLTGLLAGIGAVLAGIGLVTEAREPTGTDPRIGRLIGGLHLVPSTLGLLVATLAISLGSADAPLGVVAFIVDVGVGIAYFVLNRGPADSGSDRGRRNLARLERALGELPPTDRARMEADAREAIDVLELRDLVGADDAARAREQRLGLLAMEMAPRTDLATQRR